MGNVLSIFEKLVLEELDLGEPLYWEKQEMVVSVDQHIVSAKSAQYDVLRMRTLYK